MFRIRSSTLLLLLFVSTCMRASANDVESVFRSGERPVALIELFTSEGCSSCPPADRWLSSLKSDSDLWKSYVPVAFHVDYWDYIGWKDRFSRPEYGSRQRQYAKEGGARVVYTPGVFYQGQEWRDWRNGESAAIDNSSGGDLTVRVMDGDVAISFEPLDKFVNHRTAHVALLGMNLETRVKAGENRGRKLSHDFVALDIASVPLEPSTSGYSAMTQLPEIPADVNELALAVWISNAGAQKPIQAVGGLLPNPLSGQR